MSPLLEDLRHEVVRHKNLADRALASLSDDAYFRRPAPAVNSIAIVVKHLAGNLTSRWTDFLVADGEKPDRNRDGEFALSEGDTRERLHAAWERGWNALLLALAELRAEDLDRTVVIRGENHTARQALLRGLTHLAYHVGQILYLARWLEPNGPWLTIAPGASKDFPGSYRRS